MKGFELEQNGFTCMGIKDLQYVRGGVSVACFENLWEYVKRAVNFIMEYHKEISEGFKKGWNKF